MPEVEREMPHGPIGLGALMYLVYQSRGEGVPHLLDQDRIHNHQSRHGLNNRNSSWYNTRVVSALCRQDTSLAVIFASVLGMADSSRGLESDLEIDILAVTDTALDTAGIVCDSGKLAIRRAGECIVVLRARNLSSAEPGTNLKSLGRRNGKHCVCKLGFEFVKAWLSKSNWDVLNDTSDCTAN